MVVEWILLNELSYFPPKQLVPIPASTFPSVSFSVDGEMGRWGEGEMGRWGDGERGRWGEGEMGRWGDGEMGRWGDGEMGRWGEGAIARTPRTMNF
ncbi:MAG: hypothetical protein QQW96_20530 [Tychonema bourrellyi B0820]|nr:hypothetical protein [Tychonema bourrellyi B0820]